MLEKAKADLPAKPKKVASTPVVQSHMSVKVAQEVAASDDYGLDDDELENKPAAAKKEAKGKPAAAKKSGTSRGGKVRVTPR